MFSVFVQCACLCDALSFVSRMTDQLVEIERKDWPKLKNLYTPDGSRSYIAYTTIDNYIRWFEQDPNVKDIKFLCLNGDFSDGTFVVTVGTFHVQSSEKNIIYAGWLFKDRYTAYADTLNASFENLSELLQLIDYKNCYTFLSTRPEIQSIILDALQKANVKILNDATTLLYFLSKEDGLKLDVQ